MSARPPTAPPDPQAPGLTVADVARRYRVGADKVRGWIRRGELRAVNTAAAACARPRFVVTPQALAEFEARHAAAAPPAKPARRGRAAGIDFFPE